MQFINAHEHRDIQSSHNTTPIPTVRRTANAVNPLFNTQIQFAIPIPWPPSISSNIPSFLLTLDEGQYATTYSAAAQPFLPSASLQPSKSCFRTHNPLLSQLHATTPTAEEHERFQKTTPSSMSPNPFFMSIHGAGGPNEWGPRHIPALGATFPVAPHLSFHNPCSRSVGVTHQYNFLRVPDPFAGINATERRSPVSESSSGSFTPYSTPSTTAGGHYETSYAHPDVVESTIIPGSMSDITLNGDGFPLFPTLQPHSQHTKSTVSGTTDTTLHFGPPQSCEVAEAGVAAAAAKPRFKNQRSTPDIEEKRRRLPRDGALNKLIGRILSMDWLKSDEKEPTYSQALGLTVGLKGLKLRDGQSVFLAFQDGKQRCVLCNYQAKKPNRMVRHIRSHFGLRPYECRLSSCVSCKDM